MTDLSTAILEFLTDHSGMVLVWVILFLIILSLCVFWLSARILQTSSAQALLLARDSIKLAEASKAKIDQLDEYIRESFSKDFNGAMQSFDETTSSVLNRMKDELVQGVQRIEQIETAISKKQLLQEKVTASRQNVHKLLDAPDEQVIEADEEKV